jgi:alkylresorcinol/alkylpyrone synthase
MEAMAPSIAGTSAILPRHRYEQEALAKRASALIPERNGATLRLFQNVGVGTRHLALPIEEYTKLGGFEQRSRVFVEVATELGADAIRSVLDEAGLSASEIGMLATTTVTGIAVPSLDARLMNVLPFSPRMKRVPLFGLGCLGGAAGVARVADYLRAYPEEAALLLSVELCSLTFRSDDPSIANIVSSGLFGDGAAAVLMVGAHHRLASGAPTLLGEAHPPRVIDTRSEFFPGTERVMGWDVEDSGFKVVLSADVPDVVRKHVPPAVDGFLHDHGLERGDIARWILHPGGPKVIEALEHSLELPSGALDRTRASLERHGNLSSASVLFLLDEHRRTPPPEGAYGLMMAMGPAFCAELVLVQW